MLFEIEGKRAGTDLLALLERLGEQISPDDNSLADWWSEYRHAHKSRLAEDLFILESMEDGPTKVLEYGSIPLLLTAALRQRGFEVTGLDIDPHRFSHTIGRLGLDVRQCDVEKESAPFDTGSFDVVLFNELFEHLRINPIFTLREIHRVLKPGGRLFLSTPNLRSARGIRNLLLKNQGHAVSGGIYRQYEKLETLGHMGHVREYTCREVTEFLLQMGFDVRKVIYRGGHGKGLSGIVERLVPSMRPFFTLVAQRQADA